MATLTRIAGQRRAEDIVAACREHPDAAGLRQRALAHLPAGAAGSLWRRRLLGVARAHAGRGGAPDARARARAYEETYRRCGGGLHGRRRVPLPGLAEARAAAEAAAAAGVELVLLLSAYARGGLPRMRQESVADYLRDLEALRAEGIPVGVAPHSVRACPRDWLEELGAYAAAHELPLHVHADEQPREVEECLAEHGCRPIELLARAGCLGPHGRSCMPPTPTAPSSTCSPRRARPSAPA